MAEETATKRRKTHVYIDGFNLYYRRLSGTPYKWINLQRMCELLLPENDVAWIHYFTAHISDTPADPTKSSRQQIYLRALMTIPNLTIHRGTFRSRPRERELAFPAIQTHPNRSKDALAVLPARTRVWVMESEEKGSDVNLATVLLSEAYERRFEMAIVVSNDSDLIAPIQAVRAVGLDVGVLSTQTSHSLAKQTGVTFFRLIPANVLKASQFNDVLIDDKGEFHKPDRWNPRTVTMP